MVFSHLHMKYISFDINTCLVHCFRFVRCSKLELRALWSFSILCSFCQGFVFYLRKHWYCLFLGMCKTKYLLNRLACGLPEKQSLTNQLDGSSRLVVVHHDASLVVSDSVMYSHAFLSVTLFSDLTGTIDLFIKL